MMAESSELETTALQDLLEFLKRSRGFDFTGYKRTTLRRRIEKRLQAVGVDGYSSYQDYLEVNPREFTELFNTILINVTSFFRDAEAWEYLASEAIPELLERIPDPQPIRIWSAGCASGEEAYTAAMLLAEALGEDRFRDRVKIYATDLDEDALNDARHAVYPDDSIKAVPEQLVGKYFEPNASGLMFRQDLRRSIIFGRNDLVSDAPISRIDLLISRNVLMYFTPETQARIVERFNFALNRTGFLFLGKSEMLVTHSDLFTPQSLKWRVFSKVERNNFRERLAFVAGEAVEAPGERYAGVRAAAFQLAPTAQIAVDREGYLADANMRARDLFSLGTPDIGRPLQDLALSYRPADLRSAIDRAYAEAGPIRIGRVEFIRPGGDERILEIVVTPVGASRGGDPLGVTVTFTDVTTLARLHDDYDRSRRELETAYEELQSTVEELETTNEELQSTNEELETMNEELQSTNDELETMNQEVTSRATELDRVHTFLEGILGSLGVGVAVIDRDRTVQVWNAISADLWGLRAGEVEGEDYMQLDIGLPVAELSDTIQRSLEGSAEPGDQTVEAVNRRGRKFDCLVRVLPLYARGGDVYGAVILTAPVSDGALPRLELPADP